MKSADVPAGIDLPNVVAWFEAHAPEVTPPLSFELIPGGRSNLTFRVDDVAGHRWVLRRPPLGHVLATAHDMSREHRIISALAGTDVPVPPVVGLCEDASVNEAPFYVMGFVDGEVWRDRATAQHTSPAVRRRASESVTEVLARIHRIDPDEVGLGDLGRKDGYIERQLRRWSRQWSESKTRELPAVDEVHEALSANVPEQGRAGIVHGDYRLDNCMVGPEGGIRAVLDWELCTLGDPLADLGLLLVYWAEPGDPQAVLGDAATVLDGFATRDELVSLYAEARLRGDDGAAPAGETGEALEQALGSIHYYVAFGYWKLACILEGVYARFRAGAMGSSPEDFEMFARYVEFLAEAARATLDKHDKQAR